MLPSGPSSGACGSHDVVFYDDDARLAQVASAFLLDGAPSGRLVIATPEHSRAIADALGAAGADARRVPLIHVDANEVAASVLEGGDAHDRAVGRVLEQVEALCAGGPLRAFGEAVDLLAVAGHPGLALQLEGWCRGVLERLPVALLCSYRMPRSCDAERFEGYRRAHDAVLEEPAHGLSRAGPGPDGRLALLRAASLELWSAPGAASVHEILVRRAMALVGAGRGALRVPREGGALDTVLAVPQEHHVPAPPLPLAQAVTLAGGCLHLPFRDEDTRGVVSLELREEVPGEEELECLSALARIAAGRLTLLALLERGAASDARERRTSAVLTGLFDAAPIMIWGAGLDKRCNAFNQQWLDFTGRRLEDELGDGWAGGVHPDDMARCLATYVGAFDARRPFAMEYRLRHHSGEHRWIHDAGGPVVTSDGAFLGYIGGCIDIHALKERERTLEKRSRQHAALAELSQHALSAAKRRDIYASAVQVVKRALEVDVVDLFTQELEGPRVVASSGRALEHVTDRQDSLVRHVLATQAPVIVEDMESDRRFAPSASLERLGIRSGILVAIPGRETARGGIGALCRGRRAFSADDVSFLAAAAGILAGSLERLATQRQLAQSRRFLSHTVTHLPGFAYRCSAPPERPVLFATDGIEAVTGHPLADFVDARVTLGDLVHPEDRSRVAHELDRAIADGSPWELEYRVVVAGGSVKWLWERGSVTGRSHEGEPWLEGFVADATARKSAELVGEELNSALARSLRLADIGTIVSSVAHEVRNPLFAISATVDAIESDVASGRSDRTGSFLQALRVEVRRLTQVAGDLLDLSRPQVAHFVPLSLAAVLTEAVHACAGTAEACGVTVRIERPGELPLVRGDVLRLVQLFVNLVENSLQHSPRGGEVHVEMASDAERVDVAIRDGGPGFRTEDLQRAGEPFYSRRPGGTGLGLSIVRRLIDAHGGAVTFGNDPAGGGVVRVALPRVVDGAHEAERQLPSTRAAR